MSSRQGYAFILILLQVFLPTEVLQYNIRCPETLARHIRSRKCTSLGRHSYHCLPVNDIEYDVFKEECKTFEWITPGQYPVLRGEYIDDESCLANTYQPLLYQSDEQHTCLYQKSICSGEGLIEFDNGNTTTDRTCRCDYTKGYKFIVTPKHSCFCIPSEEDCSCFVKSCSSHYKLNADYECVTTTDGNDKEECPIIKGTDLTPKLTTKGTDLTPKLTTIRYSTTDMIKNTDHWLKSDQIIRLVPLIVLVYAFIVLIIAETKKIVDTNAENSQTGHVAVKEVSFHSTVDVELSNIFILHLDEKEGASAFKSHLENLLKDISPTVKYYEEIFEQTDKNAVLNLEDELSKCSILFVYISMSFVPSKVKKFGFNENTFLYALTEDAKENYLNLKTVIDCEEWHVYPENIRKDFKYLKLKKSDDQIKKDLIKLIYDIQK